MLEVERLDIYISWKKNSNVYLAVNKIQIPVLPERFELEGSQNNVSININNLGEINLKGKRNLYSLSFESFFPAEQYDFCKCTPYSPNGYVTIIRSLMEHNITLNIAITEININLTCTIENFNYGMEERNGDIWYSITFKEYRNAKSKKIDPVKTVTTTVKKATTKRISKNLKSHTYTWRKGDTWHKIAKKKTGTSANYRILKKQNKDAIRKAKKQHPDKKEKDALIGYKVVIKVD